MILKILGFKVPVKFVENGLFSNRAGLYDGRSQEITIGADCNRQVQNSTLIHEIIECINNELELNLEHPQLSALATGIYQVIKDNKKVFMEM